MRLRGSPDVSVPLSGTRFDASEDSAVQEGSQPTAQSESIGKDCERTGAAGDDRSHKSSERYRETQREHDDDEDRE